MRFTQSKIIFPQKFFVQIERLSLAFRFRCAKQTLSLFFLAHFSQSFFFAFLPPYWSLSEFNWFFVSFLYFSSDFLSFIQLIQSINFQSQSKWFSSVERKLRSWRSTLVALPVMNPTVTLVFAQAGANQRVLTTAFAVASRVSASCQASDTAMLKPLVTFCLTDTRRFWSTTQR